MVHDEGRSVDDSRRLTGQGHRGKSVGNAELGHGGTVRRMRNHLQTGWPSQQSLSKCRGFQGRQQACHRVRQEQRWPRYVCLVRQAIGGIQVIARSTCSQAFLSAEFALRKVDLHDDGENSLEGDWESPLYITARVVESQAYPVATHDSLLVSLTFGLLVGKTYETDQGTRQYDQRPSLMRLGTLGLI
jgi:hypothetical protein